MQNTGEGEAQSWFAVEKKWFLHPYSTLHYCVLLSCDNRDNTPWRSQKLPIIDDSSAKVNAQNAPVLSKVYCTGQTDSLWKTRIQSVDNQNQDKCTYILYIHILKWKQVLQKYFIQQGHIKLI